MAAQVLLTGRDSAHPLHPSTWFSTSPWRETIRQAVGACPVRSVAPGTGAEVGAPQAVCAARPAGGLV